MRILVADKFEQAGLDGLKQTGAEVVYEPGAGADGLSAVLAKSRPDVLIVRSSKVSAAVLRDASGLRAIIRAGAGVDNIDLPAAAVLAVAALGLFRFRLGIVGTLGLACAVGLAIRLAWPI